LTFTMSAGVITMNGVKVTCAQQNVTLAAADATNPRIDVLYVDDTGTFGKITGTPAATPSQPTVDPTSQLFLTFVNVPATATSITGITNENIYLEDTEWTTTVIGSGVTKNSTTNPFAGTKDVEFTNTPAASGIKFVRSSAMSYDGDGNLQLQIRSKATWNSKRWLTLQWYLAGVAKGQPVVLKSGTFGFDSSVTSSYQLVVINKLQFAVPSGTNVDELRILDVGGALGAYIDNIILQTNGTSIGGNGSGGLTQDQADARYVQLVNEATAPQIRAATAGKYVAADKLIAAAVPQTLTDQATIAWDMSLGFNAKVTLGGTRTFGAPTNPKQGITYALEVIQDGTGNRTVTWNAAFKWGSAGTPTLSTAAGKRDFVFLYCYDAVTPEFRATFNKDS